MNTNFSAIYTRHLEKQALVRLVMKAARCWAGYEPVPGKAPYSNDSCRPAGGKKKDKKPAEKKSADECCGPASMPAHTAYEATQQVRAKPAVVTNSKKVITGDLQQAGAAIKAAIDAAAGSSHFAHPKKELEAVVGGKKPSTENTKHHKVEPKLPSEGENLHPAASLLRPDTKPTSD